MLPKWPKLCWSGAVKLYSLTWVLSASGRKQKWGVHIVSVFKHLVWPLTSFSDIFVFALVWHSMQPSAIFYRCLCLIFQLYIYVLLRWAGQQAADAALLGNRSALGSEDSSQVSSKWHRETGSGWRGDCSHSNDRSGSPVSCVVKNWFKKR